MIIYVLRVDRSFQVAEEQVCCCIVDYAKLAELGNGVVGLEEVVGDVVGLGQVLILVTFCLPSVFLISEIP